MPDEPEGTMGPAILGRGGIGTMPGGSATPDQDTIVPTQHANSTPIDLVVELPPMGYELGELIGRGGMGEVVAAHDLRIGRDVAIKRMRSAHPDATQLSRFLREARVQARLDHPAIVPVYELGTDDHGKPFFTMKRLAGTTLAQRLAEAAPRPVLLRAFIDVCMAVDFAHARGVVHRDLKPANIMLGDYGEVYVLDWGVARVLADAAVPVQPDIETLDGETSAGVLLGTPGYMAPEQIHGLEVVPATDVYALGSILFEILTSEPLHPRGDGALGSTLTRPQQSPSERVREREIPPELDLACHDAVAEHPQDRPSARALADRVQRYLDGDRDLERRRALAGRAARHRARRVRVRRARCARDRGAPCRSRARARSRFRGGRGRGRRARVRAAAVDPAGAADHARRSGARVQPHAARPRPARVPRPVVVVGGRAAVQRRRLGRATRVHRARVPRDGGRVSRAT